VPHFYELPRDQKLFMAVLFRGGIIALDAMPWVSTKTGQEIDANAWPLPDDALHGLSLSLLSGSRPRRGIFGGIARRDN
jgi:hypothetical protein